ncbi:MAG: TIGR00529 family membrane protein, partial [Deltaproteobacteria bacterium]
MPFKLPVLIRVFVVFALILFLNRKRVPFFLCLFLGALLLGLWMRLRPVSLLLMILKDITSSQSLWLASIIAAILTLSNLLERAGQLSRIVEAFDRLSHSRKFTTLAMPALIGLLPMPAGALVSAPMVQESYPLRGGDPELKAAINYWFRHLWEYWWPLYPGVILAISLLRVETWKFVLTQMPLTAGAITGGLIFIARHIPKG